MSACELAASCPAIRELGALHDHWASYLQFPTCQHAFCNVHHLRDLLFIHEQYGQEWAAKLTRLLLAIKTEVASTSEALTALPPDRLAHYEAEYDSLIAQGLAANPSPKQPKVRPRGRPKRSPPLNLLRRLRKHKSGVLAFMYNFRIPFDNNQAERDVRMLKVQQKVSGAFRTQAGADTFCALRSTISLPHANTASTPLMPSATLSLASLSSRLYPRLSSYQ